MKRLAYLFSFLLLIPLLSCTEEQQITPVSYSRLLTGETSKTWRMDAIQILEDGRPSGSFLVPNQCDFDDVFVFYNNPEKLYIVDNGPQKCSDEEPDELVRDTWSFVNATATVEMIVPILADFKLPFIVKSLDENSMTTEIFFQGGSYRFIYVSSGTGG